MNEPEFVEVANDVFAYLQPDGTWGWSNAGLVVGDDESTLVDTLFDLSLTRAMLDTMRPQVERRPIRHLVNTHANGDHCYGNQLVAAPGVDVIASAAAAREMDEVPPALLAAMVDGADDDALGRYVRHAFGAFDFHDIDPPSPTVTFEGTHAVESGGRRVELFEVGPAHTAGDVIAWMPEERVVFTGDILFIEGTPIMWAGPLSGWIDALDRIVALEPSVIVPGHGPLTDVAGVVRLRDYFVLVGEMVGERHAGGMTVEDAIRDIDAHIDDTPYAEWTDRERIVVNVQTIWKELDAAFTPPDVLTIFRMMAAYHEEHLHA
ncbi:MAG: MBL fold metallo-hydrolase [Actinomycetota bacterium]